MIEDIGSSRDNLLDFKEINLNQDVNIDDVEQEDKLNTIKNKWKKKALYDDEKFLSDQEKIKLSETQANT